MLGNDVRKQFPQIKTKQTELFTSLVLLCCWIWSLLSTQPLHSWHIAYLMVAFFSTDKIRGSIFPCIEFTIFPPKCTFLGILFNFRKKRSVSIWWHLLTSNCQTIWSSSNCQSNSNFDCLSFVFILIIIFSWGTHPVNELFWNLFFVWLKIMFGLWCLIQIFQFILFSF